MMVVAGCWLIGKYSASRIEMKRQIFTLSKSARSMILIPMIGNINPSCNPHPGVTLLNLRNLSLQRQMDGKPAAAACGGTDFQRAAVFLNDAVGYRQPHARAAADFAGGEKRLHDAFL